MFQAAQPSGSGRGGGGRVGLTCRSCSLMSQGVDVEDLKETATNDHAANGTAAKKKTASSLFFRQFHLQHGEGQKKWTRNLQKRRIRRKSFGKKAALEHVAHNRK